MVALDGGIVGKTQLPGYGCENSESSSVVLLSENLVVMGFQARVERAVKGAFGAAARGGNP
jgi:hypothetical protein